MLSRTEAQGVQAAGDSSSALHENVSLLQEHHFISPALGGSLSIKTTLADRAGRPVEALLLYETGMPPDGMAMLRLDSLRALVDSPALEASDLQFELERCRLRSGSAAVPPIALLHAALASPVVLFSSHRAFLALGCLEDWAEHIDRLFAVPLVKIPYAAGEQELVSAVIKAVAGNVGSPLPIFSRYHGLIVQSDTAPAAIQCIEELAGKAAALFGTGPGIPGMTLGDLSEEISLRKPIVQLRKSLSGQAGHPLFLRLLGGSEGQDAAFIGQVQAGPVMAAGRCLYRATATPLFQMLVEQKTCLGVAASTPALLERNQQILQESLAILEAVRPLSRAEIIAALGDFSPEEQERPAPDEKASMFAGEVALVTGAASGIGRAVVLSLLERGAAVVALDISESIRQVSSSPGYIGMVCDLTDETAVLKAIETCVRAFGGLDMLILNAGVFPPSRNLGDLSLDYWRSVMDINLDANVTLLRECFPLLECSPRYGRVIINASRNVPAPGPGAAAYSASKAALTQLGRVAALEWGKSRIRVNTIHPHAVFDTGIWTDEVLASRAAKYGMTVDEYKTNNILGVELTSRDVGELVAEMCGPLFEKITGAQIPVDGGSDRVI